MMKQIKRTIMAFALLLGVGLFLAPTTPVGAANPIDAACSSNQDSTICNQETQIGPLITTVINVLLFIIGLIAVIMLIMGGILYATSAGDPGAVTKAKNTILYAIIGLAVAFFAYAIVNWVIARFVS